MDKKEIALPEQRDYEYALREACKIAEGKLANADIRDVCRKSGAEYLEGGAQEVIILKYLGRIYHVSLPGIEILPLDSKEKLPLREIILLLHYLTWAKGSPVTHRPVTFKELSEGYFPTFFKRAIRPLAEHFGKEPARLIGAASKLDGHKADYGDIAVMINAFPNVPVTLVLWQGDAELAPTGNILFDSSITDYLPTEDIIVLSETIVWRLVRSLKW